MFKRLYLQAVLKIVSSIGRLLVIKEDHWLTEAAARLPEGYTIELTGLKKPEPGEARYIQLAVTTQMTTTGFGGAAYTEASVTIGSARKVALEVMGAEDRAGMKRALDELMQKTDIIKAFKREGVSDEVVRSLIDKYQYRASLNIDEMIAAYRAEKNRGKHGDGQGEQEGDFTPT